MQERHGVGAIPVVMFSGKVDDSDVSRGEGARRRGLHRQAVRPRAAARLDEAAPALVAPSAGLDRDLFVWVVEHRAGPLDPVFVGLTWIGYAGLVWIALAPLLALWAGRPLLLTTALTALCVWTTDLCATALKAVVDRPRPLGGRRPRRSRSSAERSAARFRPAMPRRASRARSSSPSLVRRALPCSAPPGARDRVLARLRGSPLPARRARRGRARGRGRARVRGAPAARDYSSSEAFRRPATIRRRAATRLIQIPIERPSSV